ncbi:BTAD domain-containing putative transcriptional regulator [Streptomyces typhae]|uniref:BTAD domain-containing putative transcriptional regulator n=1 Tax=Streptomyces typhae TaxID=2681492 RepID=UPI0012F68BD3|nr:BTAD domain-containing putative transcriptional regulator [Streptomyces typhae]
MSDVRFMLLGPLEVRTGDGAVLDVPGARLRALLCALALEPGRIVTRPRLVEFIWGDQPPTDEVNAVQALVSRLRRVLPEGSVEAESGGYRLAVAPDAVDVSRFEDLVGRARAAADVTRKAELLRSALELWRGKALEDVALYGSATFDAAVARLDELYLAALGDRVDADVRLGHGPELISELAGLVAAYPLREGLVAASMRALAASGRGTEALIVYQQLRERLAEAVGVEPSAELAALHTALLRGDLGGRTDNHRTNLRAGLTSFVGKDDDLAAVRGLVAGHRLVTLTGPGGSGKTRLATEAARLLLGDLPDGAYLVELAPVRAGGELAQVVLTSIGLRDQALLGGATAGDPVDRLVAAVRDRAQLLVLDNCEHMIDAVAEFADRLLGQCHRLRILATSREPLGITGEALWQVEPLALPAARAVPAEAAASPSVRLLRDRAGAVRKDLAANEQTLAAMARICRALDGIPLAIELAAARLRTMSVEQLAHRLDDRFRLLSSGSRTALPRHKTLRAVVDWSWDLLTEAERAVLRRLSVFAGGATLEAAERVCADGLGDGEHVLDVLTALIEKSLLFADDSVVPRYRMLDTIREYAAHRLAEAGEVERAHRAHLAHFTELGERAEPQLRRAGQLHWLATLQAEHDNINAALRGAIAEGRAHEAMRLVVAVGWYWLLSGRKVEGTELSVQAASLDGEVPDDVRAMAYAVVTMFLTSGVQGDQYQAQEWIHEAYRYAKGSTRRHPLLGFVVPLERMVREPGAFLPAFEPLLTDDDAWVRALARLTRGRLGLSLGRGEPESVVDIEVGLSELRALGDRWGMSLALQSLADCLAPRGEFARACELYDQAITALTELGAVEDVVGLRARQAQLHWLLGDTARSDAALAEAQRCADRVAWPDALAELHLHKAQLARWRGARDEAHAQLTAVRTLRRDTGTSGYLHITLQDLYGYLAEDVEESRAYRTEAFRAAVTAGHRPVIAQMLIGLADLALRQGRDEQAVRLLAASEGLRGVPDRSQPDAVRIGEGARGRLGEEAFAEAERAGRGADWRELAEATLAS